MKLSYRGVSYDYTPNPTPQKAPSFAQGVYRGQAIEFQALATMPEQPVANLMWRGVPYQTGNAAPAPAPTAAAVPSPAATTAQSSNGGVTAMARTLFMRHHQRSRKREQGMMVRLAAEVGIPVADAAHYESSIQGKLPHRFGSYDRSSAAMS